MGNRSSEPAPAWPAAFVTVRRLLPPRPARSSARAISIVDVAIILAALVGATLLNAIAAVASAWIPLPAGAVWWSALWGNLLLRTGLLLVVAGAAFTAWWTFVAVPARRRLRVSHRPAVMVMRSPRRRPAALLLWGGVAAAAVLNLAVAVAGPSSVVPALAGWLMAFWEQPALRTAMLVAAPLVLVGAAQYARRRPLRPVLSAVGATRVAGLELSEAGLLATIALACTVLNVAVAAYGPEASWSGATQIALAIWRSPVLQAWLLVAPVVLAIGATTGLDLRALSAAGTNRGRVARLSAALWSRVRRRPLACVGAVAAWLLLVAWFTGVSWGSLRLPRGHDALGLHLTGIYAAAAALHRWNGRTAAAAAVTALALCPITQLTYGDRLAEELAIFAYFALCLSVGQGMWELWRERGRTPREDQDDGRQAPPAGDLTASEITLDGWDPQGAAREQPVHAASSGERLS
jgi:hypothetical protein